MRNLRTCLTGVLALGLLVPGCDDPVTEPAVEVETEATRQAARAGPNVVHVAAEHHDFVTSHDRIASGWTTFRFQNRSHAPHFLIIEKMPEVDGEQKTVEDSEEEVVPVFQNIMDDINGQPPRFPEAGFELPAWYGEVVFLGGPGLTSAGETSETRVHLEPGTYVIECYVKTADGTFHSTEGMIRGLEVTERSNAADAPPRTSGRVTIDLGKKTHRGDGISFDDGITRPGVHTFEVHFENQGPYAHFLGHDVHLVRLDDSADTDALADWMNWSVPGGLASPQPEGVTFLGGAQDMPAGSTTYVTAELVPGDYAWIAEVPDPDAEKMFVPFSVP